MAVAPAPPTPGIDLYWLPLGAGGCFVKFNGRTFEALQAIVGRRRPLDLYHSALEVNAAAERFVIELTPIPSADDGARGVVGEGAVGSRHAGRGRKPPRRPLASLPLRASLLAGRGDTRRRRGGEQPKAGCRWRRQRTADARSPVIGTDESVGS